MSRDAGIVLILLGVAVALLGAHAVAELRRADRTIDLLKAERVRFRESANSWRRYALEGDARLIDAEQRAAEYEAALMDRVALDINSASEDEVLARNQQDLTEEQRRELDDEFGLVVMDLALQQITEGGAA